MAQPHAPVIPLRPRRTGWALGFLLLIMMAGSVIIPPFYRHRQGLLKVVGVTSTGAGCGGIMYLNPKALPVRTGTTVQFANRMDVMYIRFRLHRKGSAEVLAESPWLEPGETWTYDFWFPGEYTLSNNYVDAGFRDEMEGAISVGL